MFSHFFKITFRNFRRYRTSFFINIIGLSTGLACALLIFLWVNDELGVDRFHKKDARLYKVLQNSEFPHGIDTWERTPLLLSGALEQSFPEVETAISVSSKEEGPEGILSNGDKKFQAFGLYASENYFDIFSYGVLAGDEKRIVHDRNSIAISEATAMKLFSSTDVLGQTVSWSNSGEKLDLQVTGVFKDLPANSTEQFDVIMSLDYLKDDPHAMKWTGDYGETYVVLREGTDVQQFNEQIAKFMKTQTDRREKFSLFVQQYADIYLNGKI